jgi:hypothetical protein
VKCFFSSFELKNPSACLRGVFAYANHKPTKVRDGANAYFTERYIYI